PPEEEEQAEGEGAEERPCAQVRPRPRRADERAEEDERGDDRSAAAVEEPAGEEPAEHLARAERVGEIRAVVVAAARRPRRVADERDEHPRGDERRSAGDEKRTHEPSPEAGPAPEDDHPDADGQDPEVAGDEVAGDRERERGGRSGEAPSADDRAPGQSPGERQQPHRPELRVDAVAAERVAAVLESV